MGAVNITYGNGNLGGTNATDDGVVGLICTAGIGGGLVLGTPILLLSYADAATNNIDPTNNAFLDRMVKQFYTEAGDGAKLYVLPVADTYSVADMVDVNNADTASKLLDYAQGAIKVLGALQNDDLFTSAGVAGALSTELTDAITNGQALAEAYQEKQWPVRVVLGGTSYTGVPGDLTDRTNGTTNAVAIMVGDTVAGKGAAIGLLLGRVAAMPVMRKISRVKSGALAISAAYLASSLTTDVPNDASAIEAKGYITFWSYANVAGIFFSGDRMCVSATDDYAYLALGRTIDKARRIVYSTLVNEVDDEIETNGDGTPQQGYIKTLESGAKRALDLAMTNKGECSAVSVFIDPTQNVVSTSQLKVTYGVTPVGYATEILVTLGFKLS